MVAGVNCHRSSGARPRGEGLLVTLTVIDDRGYVSAIVRHSFVLQWPVL